MNKRSFGITIAIAALGLSVAGCSKAPAEPTASTVTGAIEQQSFASPVTKITVRTGKSDTTIPVDSAGKFTATLTKGAAYQLLLAQAGGDLPIVLRRGGGRLDTTVTVKSGGAHVDLGKVTYWKSAVATVMPPAASQSAAAVCSEGDDGEQADDGDHQDSEQADGPDAADEADGGVDCVDGIDAATGAECDGGPSANQNDGEASDGEAGDEADAEDTDCDASDAMGLPENDLPDSIGCGDDQDGADDGEENDD
jgi:hypothetical protein